LIRTLTWLWRGFLFFVLFAFALKNRAREVEVQLAFLATQWQALHGDGGDPGACLASVASQV
jgi:hypothetical protein